MRVTTTLAAAVILALAATLAACGDTGAGLGEPDDLAGDTVTDGDQVDPVDGDDADEAADGADEAADDDGEATDGPAETDPTGDEVSMFDNEDAEGLYTAAVDHLLDDLGDPIRINPRRNGVNGERLAVPFPPDTIEALESRDGVSVGGETPEGTTPLTLSMPGGDGDERRMRVETPDGVFDLHFERDGDTWTVVSP